VVLNHRYLHQRQANDILDYSMDYDAAKSQLLVDCSDYDAMCNLWDDVTSNLIRIPHKK
jgi:hypothetical protein